MAKTKERTKTREGHAKRNKDVLHANGTFQTQKSIQKPIEDLLTEAANLFAQSRSDEALPLAEKALRRLEQGEQSSVSGANATCLLAEIQLEAGEAEEARRSFAKAISTDASGDDIGADAFLWLAQLSEEGGKESIAYYEKANTILRRQIARQADLTRAGEEEELEIAEANGKLSEALCSMAEVYMTDLSLEPDAEQKCEALMTEALAVTPESPSALQTLASVRISQLRPEDARAALERSLALWEDIPPEDEDAEIPDFSTRISLVRLLMEVEMEAKAMFVLERLVADDDQSVEAWYLGGWCQVLLAQKGEEEKKQDARTWLKKSLKLYKMLDYEDERLRDHAVELVGELDKELGVEEDGEDAWEDEDEDVVEGEEDALSLDSDEDADGDAEMT